MCQIQQKVDDFSAKLCTGMETTFFSQSDFVCKLWHISAPWCWARWSSTAYWQPRSLLHSEQVSAPRRWIRISFGLYSLLQERRRIPWTFFSCLLLSPRVRNRRLHEHLYLPETSGGCSCGKEISATNMSDDCRCGSIEACWQERWRSKYHGQSNAMRHAGHLLDAHSGKYCEDGKKPCAHPDTWSW